MKSIHQEDGSALIQGAGDPDGQGDTDQQINRVSNDDKVVAVRFHVGLLTLFERVQHKHRPALATRQEETLNVFILLEIKACLSSLQRYAPSSKVDASTVPARAVLCDGVLYNQIVGSRTGRSLL